MATETAHSKKYPQMTKCLAPETYQTPMHFQITRSQTNTKDFVIGGRIRLNGIFIFFKNTNGEMWKLESSNMPINTQLEAS